MIDILVTFVSATNKYYLLALLLVILFSESDHVTYKRNEFKVLIERTNSYKEIYKNRIVKLKIRDTK